MFVHSRVLIVAGLLGFSLLTACGATVSRQIQEADGIKIGLETEQNPQVHRLQTFLVTLRDQQGRVLESDDVYLDLRCQALCAINRPIAEPVGNGTYRAQTVYTMAGPWTIRVVARVAGQEHAAVFVTEVAE